MSNSQPIVTIVDDDLSVRETLSVILKSVGYLPRVFSSVEELLDSGELKDASCLLTDISMPGMDGWDLHCYATVMYPHLPIIMMTGDLQATPKYKTTKCPMILYKPVPIQDLLNAIAVPLNRIAC